MAKLRIGLFGSYYGSYSGESEPLTQDEMKVNATYIYSYLTNKGWTLNSISAMLGNMQAESTMNPGRWQSEAVGSLSMGYGLVQWTPSTKYTGWCLENAYGDPSEMDNNLKRITYELENNIQWIATNSYDISFEEFSKSTDSVSRLAKAFLLNYERPADKSIEVQNYRAELALYWYEHLSGENPSEPSEPSNKKNRKYNFLIFQANRRRNQWIKNH